MLEKTSNFCQYNFFEIDSSNETQSIGDTIEATDTKKRNLIDIQKNSATNSSADKIDTNELSTIEEDPEKQKKLNKHVEIGNRLIKVLALKGTNGNLYYYNPSGVYKLITDSELSSIIIKYIYKGALPSFCSKVIFYVKNMLYNDEEIFIDTNYVNFKNCLYDLKNQQAIPHTPSVFTVNQLNVDYIENLEHNEVVDNYIEEISNHNKERGLSILQTLGYSLTSKNNIQKIILIYGPSASNGKSTLLKIIELIIGSKNVCHKSIEEFDKDFGADGMQFKLLNISTELPLTKIKDLSTFKKTVTGDVFEAKVKFEKNDTVRSYIKHIFASNFIPNVVDTTEGYYRRLHIILLDNKFDASTTKFNLEEFCTQDNLNYLANKAFKSYLEMVNSGVLKFANETESNRIIEEYRSANDTVLAFLTDAEQQSIIYDCEIQRASMFNIYKDFCNKNELKALGKKAFYGELRNKYKFEEHTKHNGTMICFYRKNPVSKIGGINNG